MHALREAVERRNINVLVGHDFGKPLGDMARGTARFTSNRQAVSFEVDLPDEDLMPTYMLDVLKQIRTNRAGGLSPGFAVTQNGRQRLIPEPGNPGVSIRQIDDAMLVEMSIVTRPTYAETTIDLRSENGLHVPTPKAGLLWL